MKIAGTKYFVPFVTIFISILSRSALAETEYRHVIVQGEQVAGTLYKYQVAQSFDRDLLDLKEVVTAVDNQLLTFSGLPSEDNAAYDAAAKKECGKYGGVIYGPPYHHKLTKEVAIQATSTAVTGTIFFQLGAICAVEKKKCP